MGLFHATLTQGRSDTFTVEAKSFAKLKAFFTATSTAILSNVKQIVVSKKHDVQSHLIDDVNSIEPTYKTVEVFCKSKSHAKVFTLRDVKKSVTQQVIKENFKDLMIHDEPITDIYNILALDDSEGVARLTPYMYQIQYKLNSKTHTIELEAQSEKQLIKFFKNCISGELLEIRKYIHRDDTVKKDDKDYFNYKSVLMRNDSNISTLKVPKIKKTLKQDDFSRLVFETFTLKSLPIENVEIKSSF